MLVSIVITIMVLRILKCLFRRWSAFFNSDLLRGPLRLLLWLLYYHDLLDLFLHLHYGVHHGKLRRFSLLLLSCETFLDELELLFELMVFLHKMRAQRPLDLLHLHHLLVQIGWIVLGRACRVNERCLIKVQSRLFIIIPKRLFNLLFATIQSHILYIDLLWVLMLLFFKCIRRCIRNIRFWLLLKGYSMLVHATTSHASFQ